MPQIYGKETGTIAESLPPWLMDTPEGLEYLNDPEHTKWDFVADYGNQGVESRQPLPLTELRGVNDGVKIYENLSSKQISIPFRNITCFANNGFDITHPDIQTLYSANFVIATREPMKAAVDMVGTGAAVMAPERGARILKVMLGVMGFSQEQMPVYRASRKHRDGHYTVGMMMTESFVQGNGNLLCVDDCAARDGSEDTSFNHWVDKFGMPDSYAIVIGAAVRRSVHGRSARLNAMGVNHAIFAASEANSMNDDDYLTVTPEETEVLKLPANYIYRVNDMGNGMNLVTPERQREIPLYQLLTASAENDATVLELSRQAIEQPDAHTVHRAAIQLRQLAHI
jgi:hypothetical protein